MKKNTIVQVASFLFILLFVYTAVSKIIAFNTFQTQLTKQPVTEHYADILTIAIPAVELMTAALLLIPRFNKMGLYSSFLLMTLFTGYVGYMIYVWPHNTLPCSCGGIIKQLTWHKHFIFNITFTILAFIALLADRKPGKPAAKNRSTIAYA